MVILILIVAAVAAWWFLSSHDSAATKTVMKQKTRSDEQKKVIRYFLNDGCGAKRISDQEYEQMIRAKVDSLNLRKRALDKISLDEDEVKEIEPVTFEGFVWDKCYQRKGNDNLWRSSAYQVSWLFFSASQVYFYQYTINMDCDEKKENTEEYFYKDITNFSTTSETVELASEYDANGKVVKTENVEQAKFALVVPGDKMFCALEQSDENERAIKGMKNLLREKKNA